MSVPSGGIVQTDTAFDTQARRNIPIECQPLRVEVAHDLPAIPVLPQTLLLLDLTVQQACVDLRAMSQLVLADLGAALQILRLAGREYANAEGRPARIEDCISDLGLEACFAAVSAATVTCDGRQHAIAEVWAHSRAIAQHSKLVAQEMPDIDPEEAYLAGLFHSIGLLPGLLGWRGAGAAEGAIAGLRLAKKWSLPRCVTEFFSETHLLGDAAQWSGIVQKAHYRANRSPINCPFEHGLRPHLHRDEAAQPVAASFA
jgi:hypothetical protein